MILLFQKLIQTTLIIGMRTGLIGAGITVIGVFTGWLAAGQFSARIGNMLGFSEASDTIVTVIAYAIVIIITVVITRLIWQVVRRVLSLATLGLVGMVDRLGGIILGLVFGIVLSTALVMGIARLTYDIQSVQEIAILEDAYELPKVVDTRVTIEKALQGSRAVPMIIGFLNFVPTDAFGLAPPEFKSALEILEHNLEILDATIEGDPSS